ncbi:uncharacterized protein DNG_09683 [Cephalotrichum gorgonifer]|uniref:Uncharacterized protein n=1 Tax=Cephalotrichum gorgonifer TaxID=2041049 RepID=A0AAE8SZJ2_9PEZI|nr:uncharacterized protein DNG_09683 [Cephalotrichum gorgonifer]
MRPVQSLLKRREAAKEPYLPAPHAPLLTPRSSSRQEQSPFFRLPLDLRYLILRDAFGGRTIHVDFRFRPPLYTSDTGGGLKAYHGGYPPLVTVDTRLDRPTKPHGAGAWRWYSCVCHRNVPPGMRGSAFEFSASWDKCLSGAGFHCHSWPGTLPNKCMLGMMGFLLTCKQGYEDAMYVIYSTNALYLEALPLIDGLLRQSALPGSPRVSGLDTRHLTSLVMIWDFVLFGSFYPSTVLDRRHFAERLDLIPRALPKLTRLQVLMGSDIYVEDSSPANNMEEVEKVLLRPFLEARTKMEHVAEFIVTIPAGVFLAMMSIPGTHVLGQDVPGKKRKGIGALHIRYPFTEKKHTQTSTELDLWYGMEGDRHWNNPLTMMSRFSTVGIFGASAA